MARKMPRSGYGHCDSRSQLIYLNDNSDTCAGVAQLVAQLTCNQ